MQREVTPNQMLIHWVSVNALYCVPAAESFKSSVQATNQPMMENYSAVSLSFACFHLQVSSCGAKTSGVKMFQWSAVKPRARTG